MNAGKTTPVVQTAQVATRKRRSPEELAAARTAREQKKLASDRRRMLDAAISAFQRAGDAIESSNEEAHDRWMAQGSKALDAYEDFVSLIQPAPQVSTATPAVK